MDLFEGFAVSESCEERIVPLQIQVGAPGRPSGPPAAPQVPRVAGPCAPRRLGRTTPLSEAPEAAQRMCLSKGDGHQLSSVEAGSWVSWPVQQAPSPANVWSASAW